MLLKTRSWIKNHTWVSRVIPPECFVLLVLLIFGSFLAFRVPLGAGFDEETHLLRVWEMSTFTWIPNAKLSSQLPFPAFYWDNSYRRQPILEPADPNFWSDYADTPIEGFGNVPESLTTRSVYSPLLLLPQSLVMYGLGRVLQLPALTVLITMRLAGLLCYTFLTWVTVRMIPFAKWMWAILVMAPMAIYQAATVSTDSISNGIGFLFIGYCLHAATLPQIRWKEWLILALMFSLLFFAKVNMATLAFLPFIILRPSRFVMKRGLLLLGLVVGFLAVIEIGGWSSLAYTRLYATLTGANPSDQLRYIFLHPLNVTRLVVSDLGIHLLSYFRGWIADYGYGYWGSPWIIYPLYLIALISTFKINGGIVPDNRTRLGLFFVFGLSILATLMSLYVSYNPVAGTEIQGIHGRYFTVIFPLLFLGIFGLTHRLLPFNRRWFVRFTVGTTLLSILLFSTGMYLAFYVHCGTAFYRPGLCYQPLYKNWSPNTEYFPPISPTVHYTQWIMPKCNGMSSLRVWVDSGASNPGGMTQFILNDEQNDAVTLEKDISNLDLPSKAWYTLTFPEDWQSGGKWYTLTVQNHPTSPETGIQLASSIRAEYIDGPLIEGEEELEKDMIFQYGCVAGWKALYHNLVLLINKH